MNNTNIDILKQRAHATRARYHVPALLTEAGLLQALEAFLSNAEHRLPGAP